MNPTGIDSSDLVPPLASPLSHSSSLPTKPTVKSRPAPGPKQDETTPLKWAWPSPGMTPEAPNTDSAISDSDLDEKVFEQIRNNFAPNMLMNMEPNLTFLLSGITSMDDRLVQLSVADAQNLLDSKPFIKESLHAAWLSSQFKDVLGALHCVSKPMLLLT